jgi:hypothetical protein
MRCPSPSFYLRSAAGLLGALVLSAVTRAAEPALELTGVMHVEERTQIALLDKTTGVTSWVSPGQAFRGYTFTAFNAEEKTAVLRKDGVETRVRLVDARVQHGEAAGKLSPKTAKAIFHNVRQIAAAADQYYLENGKLAATLEDIVGPNKNMKRLVNVAGEDYSRITLKQGTPVVLTTAGGDVIPADATNRADATYAFYPLRSGDTGAKIAAQMNISIGELAALNPEINWSRLSVEQVVRVK